MQPYFGRENIQLHYMDCDSFVLSITNQNVDIDLNILENLFDFSNLDLYHELFSNENKKVVGEFEIETPKNIRIDKFFYLRSKAYFLCVIVKIKTN